MLILSDNNGTVVYKSAGQVRVGGRLMHYPTDRALIEAGLRGLDPSQLLHYETLDADEMNALDAYTVDQLQATIEQGVITAVVPIPEPPALYLHVTASGGDGESPIGIANSGAAERSVQFDFALRFGPDPADPVVDQASDTFRMRLRDKVTKAAKQIKRVTLTAGVGSIVFQVPDGAPEGELVLSEDDFVPVMGYPIKLAQPVEIVIFEPVD